MGNVMQLNRGSQSASKALDRTIPEQVLCAMPMLDRGKQTEWFKITQKHSGSSQWPIFYLFDRPSWEITTTMLFFWCVVIKTTSSAWHLVHFHSKSYGCLESQHLSTHCWYWLWSGRWANPYQGHCRSRPIQTSIPVYSFLLVFCDSCKPHHQEHWLLQAVEGAETVFCFVLFYFKIFLSTLHSAQLSNICYSISSPAS